MAKVGLTPSEALELSWYEMTIMAEAYSEKNTDVRWIAAWHLAPILNLMGNDLTPGHLMGTTVRKSVDELLAEVEATNG